MKSLIEFRKIKSTQISKASKYENKQSYEMAYIALWQVLEKGLRVYADRAKELELHKRISEWDSYLSGKRKIKPKSIRNFDCTYTSKNIPIPPLIEKVLGKLPKVTKILDPNGKWRKRRNAIAHDSQEFSTEFVYAEYKHDLLTAVDELSRKAALYETGKTT